MGLVAGRKQLPRRIDMNPRENRESDDVDVLGNCCGDDLLWRLLETEVHDLGSGVTQRHTHDLHPAVVPIEAGLGEDHPGPRFAGLGHNQALGLSARTANSVYTWVASTMSSIDRCSSGQ